MKRFSLLNLGALAGVMLCLAPLCSKADEYDKKTIVTISAPTEAPGIVLQPGVYVIKLLNSSSNRHIAEIMNEKMDHLYALTFTAAAERLERAEKPILTFYEGSNGRPQALRKWFWPGDTIGQEFIYPKDQAARIAAATKEKVLEGPLPTLAESGQSLTPDNLQSSTSVSSVKTPDTTTALAARPVEPEPAKEPEPVTIAQNVPPPPQPQRAVEEVRQAEPVVPSSPPVQQAAVNDTSATTLPQTASHLPLIGVIGILSVSLAGFLGFARRNRPASNR